MENHQINLRLFFTATLILILSASNNAQFFILKKSPLNSASVDLKFTHPVLKNNDLLNQYDQAIYSGSYDFDVSIPVSNSLNINILIPVSLIKNWNADSETDIGNIYLGVQTKNQFSKIRSLRFSVGLFLPTASRETFLNNFSSYLINRYDPQKYFPNAFTLYLNWENRWDFRKGHIIKIDVGGQGIVGVLGSGDVLFHYGFGGGFAFRDFLVLAEIAGIAVINSNSISFSDRFSNALSIGLNYGGHFIKPGIFYKFHLDDWTSDLDSGAFGFNIQFDFP